jgi:hypothetical protein
MDAAGLESIGGKERCCCCEQNKEKTCLPVEFWVLKLFFRQGLCEGRRAKGVEPPKRNRLWECVSLNSLKALLEHAATCTWSRTGPGWR